MKKKTNRQDQAQLIIMMGVILALAVFVIASTAAELASQNIELPSERATTLTTEFTQIKDTFGISLNYNLIESIENITTEKNWILYGDIGNINQAFEQTKKSYYIIELKHDIYLDATLNHLWYSQTTSEGNMYKASITLHLDNGNTQIIDTIIYSIICTPNLPE